MDFLARLDALGVPLFIGWPHGWPTLTAAGNAARLASWRAGVEVHAVLGGVLSVVDVDVKNGANVNEVRCLLAELGIPILAEVETPSGGAHFYVRHHPALPTKHAIRGRPAFEGWPGLEVLATGTNVFTPPTIRNGQPYVVVADQLDAQVGPDETFPLVHWIRTSEIQPARWESTPYAKRTVGRAMKAAQRAIATAPNGSRNGVLFRKSVSLGKMIGGLRSDSELTGAIRSGLVNAAVANPDPESTPQIMRTITNGMALGVDDPKVWTREEVYGPREIARRECRRWLLAYGVSRQSMRRKDVLAAARVEGYGREQVEKQASILDWTIETRGWPKESWWTVPSPVGGIPPLLAESPPIDRLPVGGVSPVPKGPKDPKGPQTLEPTGT
jgi:hypothetical protein